MSGSRRWAVGEERTLARLYRAGRPREEIAHVLGRSVDAIDGRRRTVGLPARVRPRPWSEREDALIAAATAAGIRATELAQRIGRPVETVRARRRRLGLGGASSSRYSPVEEQAIRRCLADGGDLKTLARQLGRSYDALRLHARAQGLLTTPPRKRWQPEDDRLLHTGYARGLSCKAIATTLLPQRTPGAIAARASLLGLGTHGRLWTADDEAMLRALLARDTTLEQIARQLERTPEAIRQRTRKRGLPVPRTEPHPAANARWQAKEDTLLREQPSADTALLARRLGRSDIAIRRRLAALGLREGRKRSPHRAPAAASAELAPLEQRLVLRALSAGPPRLLALSRRLGRPPGELKRLALERRILASGGDTAAASGKQQQTGKLMVPIELPEHARARFGDLGKKRRPA